MLGCFECDTLFTTDRTLRRHNRCHLHRLSCQLCPRRFYTRELQDFCVTEFHRVEAEAQTDLQFRIPRRKPQLPTWLPTVRRMSPPRPRDRRHRLPQRGNPPPPRNPSPPAQPQQPLAVEHPASPPLPRPRNHREPLAKLSESAFFYLSASISIFLFK